MKQKITIYLMIFSILLTLVPFTVQAETVCEDTVFKVKVPQKEATEITGTALADHPYTVKVNDLQYEDIVKTDGTFVLQLDTPLKGDEKIEIVQGENKLTVTTDEVTVTGEKSLETPFQCQGLVTTEEPTTEVPTSEAVTTEQDTTEMPSTEEETIETSTTELPTTEQVSTETPVSEETTTEDVTTEELTTEMPQSEKVEEPITEQPTSEAPSPEIALPATELPPIGTVTSETPTADPIATEQPVTEAPIIFRPTLKRSFAITANTSVASLTAPCPTDLATYNANRSAAVTKAVTGKIACVSTAAEFDSAVRDRTVEVVYMTANITTSSANNIVADAGQKVIDVNGYILHLTNSEGLTVPSSSTVKEVVVQNAGNLLNTVSSADRGLVNADASSVNVRYSNITYNGGSATSAHLGQGVNSTIYFYGTNKVNVVGPDFTGKFGQVRVQDGASLNMNTSKNGLLFSNTSYLNTVGLFIGKNANVSINGTNGDVLHMNSNVPYNVSVGVGSSLSLTGNKAVYVNLVHTASGTSNILFDAGSVINIKSNYNALKLGNEMVEVNIKNGAKVNLRADQDVFYTDPSSLNFPFNIEADAKVVIEKTGTSNAAALNISNPFTYNINQSASVDFINPTGVIFTRSDLMTFNITNVAVRKWTTDVTKATPDKQTAIIPQGKFTMKDVTTAVSGMPTNFASDFNPSMHRLQFIQNTSAPIPQPSIYDDSAKITGTAEAGSTVTMSNSRNASMQTTTADANGNFAFTIADGSLVKGDILSFSSTANGYTSAAVTRTVIGTELTLITPADIIFKTTPIQNKPALLIYRETPSDYSLKVKDTKTRGSWQVTVQATRPMTDSKGNSLSDALVFKEGSTITSLKSAVKVTDKTRATVNAANEYTTTWGPADGILLRTNPVQASADTYTGTLTWTLTSGP